MNRWIEKGVAMYSLVMGIKGIVGNGILINTPSLACYVSLSGSLVRSFGSAWR